MRSNAYSRTAGLALLFGAAMGPAAMAQSQSWDVPLSIGPISGTLQGTDNITPQGITGGFGYSGSGSQQGYSANLNDTDAWSLGRSGLNDTFGAGGSVAGNGRSASGVGLGAASLTPGGSSFSYGLGESTAGNGQAASSSQLGSASFGPAGTRYTEGSGSSAAGDGLSSSSVRGRQMGAGAIPPMRSGLPAYAPFTAGGAR